MRRSLILHALSATVLLASVGVAHAGHSDTERIVDDSPYTLRPGEVKLGLASLEIGLWGHPLLRMLDIGTNPWLWSSNALGVRSYNVRGKYEFYSDERLSLSLRSAFYQIGHGRARLRLVPVEVYGAVKIAPDWTVGLGYRRTNLSARGGVALTEDVDLIGDLGFTTSQLRGMAEWRMSQRTAFVLRGELQQYQRVRIEAGAGNEDMEGGAFYDRNLLPAELAFNVSAVAAWSWDTWNIELGLQYGNPTLPGMTAVIPERLILPVVDLYWRF